MSKPRRTLRRFEGLHHVRFLTCSCYHRLPLFGNNHIKRAFVEHLALVQRAMNFELFAWVVMPEHVHLLLRPAHVLHAAPFEMLSGIHQAAHTVTQILRRLKAPFGKRIIERWRDLDAPILAQIADSQDRPRFWQPGGGYDRNIFTDTEFIEKIEYVHANPVQRGLANSPVQYSWSSARFFDASQDYIGPVMTTLT